MHAMRMKTQILKQTPKIPFGPKFNIIIYLFYLDVKLQISPRTFSKLPFSPKTSEKYNLVSKLFKISKLIL